MTEYIKNQVAVFITKLKSWWIGLTDYLKTKAEDLWNDIGGCLKALLKENVSIPVYEVSILTKKE